MAQLILNLDEEFIMWMVSSAAREHSSLSKWVRNRLAVSDAIPPLPGDGGAWDSAEPDPFADDRYDHV